MSREYPAHPLVGIGIAVVRLAPAAILLARRGKPPREGSWTLPGGAQELGETAEAAARRELAEETGLRAGRLTLVGNVDVIHRDPAGRVQFHYTILDFAALWTGGIARAGDDASELAWARFDQLDAYQLQSEARRIIEGARRLFAR